MSLPWMLFTLSNTNGSSLSAFEVVEIVNEGPWAVEDFVKGMETARAVLRLRARPAAVSHSASFAELESMATATVKSSLCVARREKEKKIWLDICSQADFDTAHVIAISLLVQVAVLSHQSNKYFYMNKTLVRNHSPFGAAHSRHYNLCRIITNIKPKQKNAQGVSGYFCERCLETTRTLGHPHTFFQNRLATLPV